MAHDIFISYSHKDKATADTICAYLESSGIRCWYAPRDIVPGADWADSIINAINNTQIMVLVFTDHSNISPQVLREVNNAVSAGITIIPFRLTTQEPVAGMKYYLSTVHWLDAINGDLKRSVKELCALCQSILDIKNSGVNGKHEEPSETLDETKKKRKMIGAAIAIAVVVIIAIVCLLVLPAKKGTSVPSIPDTTEPVTEEQIAMESATAVPKATTALDAISMDTTETYTQGNSQGNLQVGGYIACDGEWYYYRSNDKQSMYKMRIDGSETQKLTYEPVSHISVTGGYIYYYTNSSDPAIKRMKTDGTDMAVLHMGPTEGLRLMDGRIYFRDSRDALNLYSMSMEGKDVRLENTIQKAYSWCSDGKYMYYANQNENGALYRVLMDGSDPTCLTDHRIEGLTIAGNRLYYNDLETNYFSSYDLSTGEIQKLCNDYIFYINVTEDGIYGYSGSYDTKLCYMQLNGLGQRLLSDCAVKYVCVAGEKILYYAKDDEEYRITDLSGEHSIVA